MSSVRIELDSEGVQELLKSNEIAAVCEQAAEKMTRATGMAYESDVFIGKTRVAAGGYQEESSND